MQGVDQYLIEGCGRCKLHATPECKVHLWHEELLILRSVALDSGLTEELKWDVPCYTFNSKNICIISAFKNNCTISFFKGVLLNDVHQLLQKPGENSNQVRLIRFNNQKKLVESIPAICDYIKQAIEVEKAGIKVPKPNHQEIILPIELQDALKEDDRLKQAFERLTPGRQRAYALHISSAKQTQTRISRIEKCYESIMRGKGPLEY
jgi:uncharacterized protein YdeI (YjbR/CyaY-like superfamily)